MKATMQVQEVPVTISFGRNKYEIIGNRFQPRGFKKHHIVRFHFEKKPLADTVIVMYENEAGNYSWDYSQQPTHDQLAKLLSSALQKKKKA